MAVDIIITNSGRAALVNAQNTGTAPVTIAQVGVTATAFTAAAAATALPGEIKRVATISGEVVADDTIHVNVTDSSADVYDLRGFGLYLADGTLFALYGQAAPLLSKAAESIGAIAIDVIFADIAAASLTFGNANFTNPPATTERAGSVELATIGEAQAGIDALRALTPAGARAAVLGWLLAQDGAGSGLDADLLDGQQGSWYADITGRLGYTPLNATAYTAGDVRAKLLTVDGSGSGLDADLLDGQDSGWYTDITARLGYTPLNANTYTAADVRAKLLTVDGSGSGLDADLLDGRNSDQFVGFGLVQTGSLAWGAPQSSNQSFGGLELRESGLVGSAYTHMSYAPGINFHWSQRTAGRFLMDAEGQFVLTGANDIATERRSLILAGLQANQPVQISHQNALLLHPGVGVNSKTVIQRTDGTDFWILLSAISGSPSEVFDALRPLRINLSTGRIGSMNGQSFEGGMDVDTYARFAGNPFWHGGNDGAGSGLDADLLDGMHASDFVSAASFVGANQQLQTNGFQKLPGGLIMQWGEIMLTQSEGLVTVSWPVAFPNACFPPVGIIRGAASGADMWLQLESYNQAGATFRYQSTGGNQGYGLAFEVKGY